MTRFGIQICFTLLMLWPSILKAQSVNIAPLIKAWEVSDTSQTRIAEATYVPLRLKNNPNQYHLQQKTVAEFESYLKKNPNDRLRARLTIYEVRGKISYSQQITQLDQEKISQSIKLAYKLKDDQLKSELFALYASVNYWNDNIFLLYNIKSILLQQKVGVKYFEYDQNRYFNLSSALYRADKHEESIYYGKQSLAFMKYAKKKDTMDYIFQHDIIGANYIKLHKPDSGIFYYQQMLNMLAKYQFDSHIMQRIWTAIAKGRIGQSLILKGNEIAGVPLVRNYLDSVKVLKDTINITIGENILASVNYNHQRYQSAIDGWKRGYQYALRFNLNDEQILALHGIAKSFTKLNQADSAIKYFKIYEQARDKRSTWLNSLENDKLKFELSFEDLQNDVELKDKELSFQKLVRNFVITSAVLLLIIGVLIYKRKVASAKYQKMKLLVKQQEAEKELLIARKRVEDFSKNILEKDRIIYDLSKLIKPQKPFSEEEPHENPLLKYILLTEQELIKFKEMVNNAYPTFYTRLEFVIPNITPAEERIASLICLKLNDRQMANMLGISKESVGKSKRRLKQKLTIPEGQTLEDYIYHLATWFK